MTWRLVTIAPLGVTMKPLPCPMRLPLTSSCSMTTTAGACSFAISLADLGEGLCARTGAAKIKSEQIKLVKNFMGVFLLLNLWRHTMAQLIAQSLNFRKLALDALEERSLSFDAFV